MPAVATAATNFVVSVDPELTRFEVRACFTGTPSGALVAAGRQARRSLANAALVRRAERWPLDAAAGTLDLQAARSGDCVEYEVGIAAPGGDSRRDALRRIDGAVVGPSSGWLWRPREPAAATTVRFDLPAGMQVSAPWPETASHTYRLTDTPAAWRDQIAVGLIERIDIPVTGGRLRLALLGSLREEDAGRFERWLSEAAAAVAGLYERFPEPHTQVLLLPAAPSAGAVPWGQVLRGGAPSVLFVVNPARPLGDLRADWTAVHEFSHLLLPFVSRRDAWVSEGFASYYQNLLRARAGMIDPADAWSNLWAGFGRGRAATRAQLTLAEATREMYGPNLMRVYWAGAALALDVDIELRRRLPARRGLDEVLAALGACCLAPDRLWTGDELFAKLDRLAGTDFLQAMYRSYAESRDFPDVDAMFRELGIEPQGDSVRLAGGPAEAALRAELDGSAAATARMHHADASYEHGNDEDRRHP